MGSHAGASYYAFLSDVGCVIIVLMMSLVAVLDSPVITGRPVLNSLLLDFVL